MNFENYTITPSCNLIEALKRIDINKKGFLLVLDYEGKVVGTLTDGDIRRFIVRTGIVDTTVEMTYNRTFEKIYIDDNFGKIIDLFKDTRTNFLPIVNANDFLQNIITKNNMHVLLMEDIAFDLTFDFLSLDDRLLEHEIYNRPWGVYKTTFLNHYSQSKIIRVNPNGALSLQEHKKREENWIVIYGVGEVTIGESQKRVEAGSYIYIPKGCKHKLVNTSDTKVLMVAEVQFGDYFGEDDIIRYEDIYGRI